MKCPKCQYISFDSGDRCRNCGYEFSLAPDMTAQGDVRDPDLPIQDGTEAIGPFADLSLNETPNLPLFTRDGRDPDAPLVTPSAAPRAPLAVRRAAPAVPRPRPRRESASVDPGLALEAADLLGDPMPAPVPVETRAPSSRASAEPVPDAASTGARLLGGLIDFTLVGGIDVVVLYFTLRICNLRFADVFALPMAPLVSFFVLLNGGYLATFVAASGQTIGKMAAGTRVVPADPAAPVGERVSLGHAAVRAGAYVVSALPLGLGFISAMFGPERRALHDRLADTRVVKA